MTVDKISSFLPPLIALFLAAVSIAALYYWWMTTEENKEDQEDGDQPPIPTDRSSTGEQSTGGFLDDSITYMQSLIARIRGVSDDTGMSEKGAGTQDPPPMPRSTTSQQPYQPAAPIYASTVPSSVTPALADEETVEVLRILRDLADGSLIVDIGGRRYRQFEAIEDQRIIRRVQGVAYDLARFVDPDLSLDSVSGTQPSISPPPPAPASSTSPLDPAKVPDQPIITPPPPASTPPSVMKKEDEQEEEAPELRSMADQIEDLLQTRLSITPELASREIHIHEAVGGGVTIQVDDQYFDGVGDVADDQVREFIQMIIREWEARQ